jgi:radical SAM protein (TIGR01212 family)
MEKGWNGLPYNPISQHYLQVFGKKAYKIPVTVVDDCPNRRGLKGMQTCVFCDVWGSAAKAESLRMELRDQIETYHQRISAKQNAELFLIYFQAYTNTFTKLTALKENFSVALSYPWVKGIVVGTRPDCLSDAVLDLWQATAESHFLSVEFGVQSFNNQVLNFYRRGHTAEQSLRAIEKTSSLRNIDMGIHLMFGAPGETLEDAVTAAKICNDLPITHVKLHNLHVLKNTPLETIHARGEFSPLEFEAYCETVRLFLEHLSPRIFVHRLAAYAPRWDELVAPLWTADKMKTHQGLIDYLRKRQSYQSKLFHPQTPKEQALQLMLQTQSSPSPM